jgi:hypothetical protein
MFRKILLAGALGVLATPAFAATQVTVNLAGLDAKAVHAVIYHAAQAACRAELADETPLVQFYNRPTCITETVNRAEAKLETMHVMASR